MSEMPKYMAGVFEQYVRHPYILRDGGQYMCETQRPKLKRWRFKLISQCRCGAYLIEWKERA